MCHATVAGCGRGDPAGASSWSPRPCRPRRGCKGTAGSGSRPGGGTSPVPATRSPLSPASTRPVLRARTTRPSTVSAAGHPVIQQPRPGRGGGGIGQPEGSEPGPASSFCFGLVGGTVLRGPPARRAGHTRRADRRGPPGRPPASSSPTRRECRSGQRVARRSCQYPYRKRWSLRSPGCPRSGTRPEHVSCRVGPYHRGNGRRSIPAPGAARPAPQSVHGSPRKRSLTPPTPKRQDRPGARPADCAPGTACGPQRKVLPPCTSGCSGRFCRQKSPSTPDPRQT